MEPVGEEEQGGEQFPGLSVVKVVERQVQCEVLPELKKLLVVVLR